MTLADLISPGSSCIQLHFPAESASATSGEIWEKGEKSLRALRAEEDGKPVAIVLANTLSCATVLAGAVAAGQSLVSVPTPPRGVNPDWYRQFISRICSISGAKTLLVDPSQIRLFPAVEGIRFIDFDSVLKRTAPAPGDPATFTLTQFTSGSTSDPKGIVLSGAKIVVNVRTLLDWLQPMPGDGVCTWLPFSHDMGLIGTFLTSLAAGPHIGSKGMNLVIMPPKTFIRSPSKWLTACDEFGASYTAAPSYAYEMAARSSADVQSLKRLRTCIVGAEPIRASALEVFSDVFNEKDFKSTAFSPAYGMAEAALAVTGTQNSIHWHARDMDSLVSGPIDEVTSDSRIVGCGKPLPGYEVKIDGDGVGEILIRGPSIADAYADGTPVKNDDGWFHTRDIGIMRSGELYVLGRTDDVFQVAGRNIYAVDVEAYAGEAAGLRAQRVVVVPEGSTITLVAECEPAYYDHGSVSKLAQDLKRHIVSRVGVAPQRVLLARRGSIPLTASGKIRRKQLLSVLQSSELNVLPGSIE